MTTLAWDDPRLHRLIQRLVDGRLDRRLARKVPERHYGVVVVIDTDKREVTVRQQRGSVTVDVPRVKYNGPAPMLGQSVGYMSWRETGDVYVDTAFDVPVVEEPAVDPELTTQVDYVESQAPDYVVRIKELGDAEYRASLGLDDQERPILEFGNGADAPDVSLYRLSPGLLMIEGDVGGAAIQIAPAAIGLEGGQINLMGSAGNPTQFVDSYDDTLRVHSNGIVYAQVGPTNLLLRASDIRFLRTAAETLVVDDGNAGRVTLRNATKLLLDASHFQSKRVTLASIATTTSLTSVTVTWDTPFADASYTVLLTVLTDDVTGAGNSGVIAHMRTQTAAGITARVTNQSSTATVDDGILHAVAIHDSAFL